MLLRLVPGVKMGGSGVGAAVVAVIASRIRWFTR